jgi:hypothetical protein
VKGSIISYSGAGVKIDNKTKTDAVRKKHVFNYEGAPVMTSPDR